MLAALRGTRHLRRPGSLPRHLRLRRFRTHVQPTLDPSALLELHAPAAYIAFHVAGSLQLYSAFRRDRAGNPSGNDEVLRLDIAGHEAVLPHYDRLRSSDDTLHPSFDPDDPSLVQSPTICIPGPMIETTSLSSRLSVLFSFAIVCPFPNAVGSQVLPALDQLQSRAISGTHQLQGVYHPASLPRLEVQMGSRRLSRAPGERYHFERLDRITLGYEGPRVVTI